MHAILTSELLITHALLQLIITVTVTALLALTINGGLRARGSLAMLASPAFITSTLPVDASTMTVAIVMAEDVRACSTRKTGVTLADRLSFSIQSTFTIAGAISGCAHGLSAIFPVPTRSAHAKTSLNIAFAVHIVMLEGVYSAVSSRGETFLAAREKVDAAVDALESLLTLTSSAVNADTVLLILIAIVRASRLIAMGAHPTFLTMTLILDTLAMTAVQRANFNRAIITHPARVTHTQSRVRIAHTAVRGAVTTVGRTRFARAIIQRPSLVANTVIIHAQAVVHALVRAHALLARGTRPGVLAQAFAAMANATTGAAGRAGRFVTQVTGEAWVADANTVIAMTVNASRGASDGAILATIGAVTEATIGGAFTVPTALVRTNSQVLFTRSTKVRKITSTSAGFTIANTTFKTIARACTL